jgi:hypothetical protein
VVFQLELPHQWKIHNVFHASLLTPYIETELHGQNFPEPPPEIVEGDPEFEVEQIVGSRRIGKKKSLQYKIHWKGYSLAHDSWESAAQVHAPELIKWFQKTRSSHQNNATINYQATSGIPSRPRVLTPPWDYTSQAEAEGSESNVETDTDPTSGKRTRNTRTAQMENYERSLSSNNDKRTRGNPENIIIPPFFHINSCTMENNKNIPPPFTVEEIRNLDLSDIDPTLTKIYDELVRVLGEAHRDPARNASPGPLNVRPRTTVESDESNDDDARSKQTSPALTENIHPRYPYRENLGENDDLPERTYPRLYLATQTDQVSGDPRIRGKEEKGSIPYDEGTLTAQPMEVVYDDIEDEVALYPLGEDAYLDTDFLRAMGNIDNRGLAAESLCLVQLQSEFRYLEKWQKRLETREQAIHLEQGDLIQKKRAAHTRQTEVYKRLCATKAASRIVPRLI